MAMQTYQYEYASYPEQQASLMGVSIDRVDKQLNPISYAAQIMVTPFRYETAREVIIFYPQIRLSIRLKEGKNEVSSSVSAPPFNAKPSTLNQYDLTGRRLSAPPTKGVYIENGRKKVVK